MTAATARMEALGGDTSRRGCLGVRVSPDPFGAARRVVRATGGSE